MLKDLILDLVFDRNEQPTKFYDYLQITNDNLKSITVRKSQVITNPYDKMMVDYMKQEGLE